MYIFILLEVHLQVRWLEVGWLGPKMSVDVVLWGYPHFPLSGWRRLHPTRGAWECLFHHVLDIWACGHVFITASLTVRNGIRVLMCISLVTNELEQHRIYLMVIFFLIFLFENCLFIYFSDSIRFLVLCSSTFKSSLCMRDISHLWHI